MQFLTRHWPTIPICLLETDTTLSLDLFVPIYKNEAGDEVSQLIPRNKKIDWK